MRDLCAAAVDAATGAGAEYADARVVAKRNQFVATKNGRVERLADSESEGIGVRVLVNGAWGFACDRRLSSAGAREAALRACTFARAAAGRHSSRQLAPVASASATHRTAVERDPFEVSLDEKVAECLAADEGMNGPDIVVRQAMVEDHFPAERGNEEIARMHQGYGLAFGRPQQGSKVQQGES